jgi:hypothetical protein
VVTYTRPPKSIRPVTLSDLLPLSDPVLLLFYFVTNRPPNRKNKKTKQNFRKNRNGPNKKNRERCSKQIQNGW